MTLVAVFLIALVPRLAYFAWSPPVFAGEYWDLSSSLLDHGTLALDGVRTTRFEPLYPLFIAGARMLTGGNVAAVQGLQIGVASLGAVWLFLLARELAGSTRVAWIAVALYACHPLLVRHAADHSDSALMTTAILLFAYAFTRTSTPARAAVAGACLGIATLTRAVALPIIPLAAVVLLTQHMRTPAVVFLLASLAVASPMLVRDYEIRGSLAPARQGVNLFIGNSEYSAAIMPDHSPDILQRYATSLAARELPGLAPDSPVFPDEADAVLGRLAWEEIARHPLQALALKLRNVWYFFSPFLVPSHELTPDTAIAFGPSGRVTVSNAPLRPLSERVTFAAASCLILVLAIAGVLMRGRALRHDGILWSVLFCFVAVYSLYFPATRYAAPVVFVMLFYAAVGIDGAMTTLSGARAR